MIFPDLETNMAALCRIIARLLDGDIFPWLENGHEPTEQERTQAATIVADRLCRAVADDIVRAARKWDQLMHVADYLNSRGYREHPYSSDQVRAKGEPGTYKLAAHVPLVMGAPSTVAIDVVIQRNRRDAAQMPLLLDVKSSPSFATAYKHRREGAEKLKWLRMNYGSSVPFVLMLGGHFDAGYLGVQAAEGVDWVWEHRVEDVEGLGV